MRKKINTFFQCKSFKIPFLKHHYNCWSGCIRHRFLVIITIAGRGACRHRFLVFITIAGRGACSHHFLVIITIAGWGACRHHFLEIITIAGWGACRHHFLVIITITGGCMSAPFSCNHYNYWGVHVHTIFL